MSTLNETALVGFLSLDFSFVALVDLVSQPLSPPLHADLLNLYAPTTTDSLTQSTQHDRIGK